MKKLLFTLLTLCCFNATAQTLTTAQTLKDCSSCATQIITPEQIQGLSVDELRFLTNDLFAREGYKFKSAEIDNFYSNMAWYQPVTDNEKIVYNAIEKQNIKLLQDKAAELKADREKLIAKLKDFKAALLANDKAALLETSGYLDDSEESSRYLTEAFTKIDLDDIHWSLNTGIYKVTVDNGARVMAYEIQLYPNGFAINYGNQGGSEIGHSLYPNDQIAEFSYWWKFGWNNYKIELLKVDVAG